MYLEGKIIDESTLSYQNQNFVILIPYLVILTEHKIFCFSPVQIPV